MCVCVCVCVCVYIYKIPAAYYLAYSRCAITVPFFAAETDFKNL